VSTFDAPDKVKLGSCKLIEQIMIGEDRLLKFSGVPLGALFVSRNLCIHLVYAGEACTIVLRGATQQILDEAERSMHDALCVLTTHLKETKTVCGGGKCWCV
jgi:T-complex protein 1 subunit beta